MNDITKTMPGVISKTDYEDKLARAKESTDYLIENKDLEYDEDKTVIICFATGMDNFYTDLYPFAKDMAENHHYIPLRYEGGEISQIVGLITKIQNFHPLSFPEFIPHIEAIEIDGDPVRNPKSQIICLHCVLKKNINIDILTDYHNTRLDKEYHIYPKYMKNMVIEYLDSYTDPDYPFDGIKIDPDQCRLHINCITIRKLNNDEVEVNKQFRAIKKANDPLIDKLNVLKSLKANTITCLLDRSKEKEWERITDLRLDDTPVHVYLTNSNRIISLDYDELSSKSDFVGIGYFIDYTCHRYNYSIDLLIISTDQNDVDLLNAVESKTKKIFMHPELNIIYLVY